jgi:hypothetical protein
MADIDDKDNLYIHCGSRKGCGGVELIICLHSIDNLADEAGVFIFGTTVRSKTKVRTMTINIRLN